MIARQLADEAELLRQYGPAADRSPQQHAARADEALIGREHDVALAARRVIRIRDGQIEEPTLEGALTR